MHSKTKEKKWKFEGKWKDLQKKEKTNEEQNINTKVLFQSGSSGSVRIGGRPTRELIHNRICNPEEFIAVEVLIRQWVEQIAMLR